MVHTISDIKLKLAKCDVAVTVKTDKILFTFKDSNVNRNVRTTKSPGGVKETNDALGKKARSNLPEKLSEMSLMQLASVPVKIVQPNCSKKHPPLTFKDSNVNRNVRTTKSPGGVKETNDALGKKARSSLPEKLSEMSLMQLASVPVKIVQPNCSKKHPSLSNRQIIHGWWRH